MFAIECSEQPTNLSCTQKHAHTIGAQPHYDVTDVRTMLQQCHPALHPSMTMVAYTDKIVVKTEYRGTFIYGGLKAEKGQLYFIFASNLANTINIFERLLVSVFFTDIFYYISDVTLLKSMILVGSDKLVMETYAVSLSPHSHYYQCSQ